MKINKLDWDASRIAHIETKHRVKQKEVEQVCFEHPVILKGRSRKNRANRVYQVMGQTHGGRYLFVIVKLIKKGVAWPITARDMDSAEREWFRRR